jgi:hypothetical protein
MRVKIWVVCTTIPERGEGPCLPALFGTAIEAEAYAETSLRDEWDASGMTDEETGVPAAYPGDWRSAQDRLMQFYGDGSWGTWEISAHEVEIDLAQCYDWYSTRAHEGAQS